MRTCDLSELADLALERRQKQLGLAHGDVRNGGGASGSGVQAPEREGKRDREGDQRSSKGGSKNGSQQGESKQGGAVDDEVDVPRQNGDKLWLFPRIKVGR